jgi:hypothetical protein
MSRTVIPMWCTPSTLNDMFENLSGLFTLSVNIMKKVFRLVNHNGLKTFAVEKIG